MKKSTKTTKSKSKTTKKTSSKPHAAISHLQQSEVWKWITNRYDGKDAKILNIADSNKDTEFLREKGYNVTQISPNNIEEIECDNQYNLAIVTYLNKIISNEEERNFLLYEISERIDYDGYTIISCTNNNLVDEEWDVIEENSKFTIYLV